MPRRAPRFRRPSRSKRVLILACSLMLFDSATSVLMKSFYSHLNDGAAKAEALRQAKTSSPKRQQCRVASSIFLGRLHIGRGQQLTAYVRGIFDVPRPTGCGTRRRILYPPSNEFRPPLLLLRSKPANTVMRGLTCLLGLIVRCKSGRRTMARLNCRRITMPMRLRPLLS
jgi:hypothetical protein